MIKIKEKKTPKRKQKPHYILTYQYMIGDADGDTTEKVEVSSDNPFLERYAKLLRKLKPPKSSWGIALDSESIYEIYEEKQITKNDYDFLMALMFDGHEDEDSTFKFPPEHEKYTLEFFEGVNADTEYSFLTFKGVKLQYVDENGVKHDTVITK